MELIGYIATVFIGLSLGLIGSGGTIMTVPILVYLFEIEPERATTYSLFIVGLTSFIGVISHIRQKNIHYKSALYFALPSVISLLLVRRLMMPLLPHILFYIGNFGVTKSLLIMLSFAFLMILASVKMIKKSKNETHKAIIDSKIFFFLGLFLGIIMGFLGAGGGFLIVPSLMMFGDMDIKKAIGTSLLIIFINSFLGFMGDLFGGVILHYQFLLELTAIAIFGMIIGSLLSKKIKSEKLKPAFGWFILVMACLILIKEIYIFEKL